MTENKRGRRDEDVAEGILDADDTGLVRNEADIVKEEIDEGLSLDEPSPEENPVERRGP